MGYKSKIKFISSYQTLQQKQILPVSESIYFFFVPLSIFERLYKQTHLMFYINISFLYLFITIYLCGLSLDQLFFLLMHPIIVMRFGLFKTFLSILTIAAPGTFPNINPNIAPAPAPRILQR